MIKSLACDNESRLINWLKCLANSLSGSFIESVSIPKQHELITSNA